MSIARAYRHHGRVGLRLRIIPSELGAQLYVGPRAANATVVSREGCLNEVTQSLMQRRHRRPQSQHRPSDSQHNGYADGQERGHLPCAAVLPSLRLAFAVIE